MPSGGYIWVARGISAWCTRCPPLRTFTAPWRRYESEAEAAKAAIRDVWDKYIELQGLSRSDCPIEGLFAEPTSGSASSAAASTT